MHIKPLQKGQRQEQCSGAPKPCSLGGHNYYSSASSPSPNVRNLHVDAQNAGFSAGCSALARMLSQSQTMVSAKHDISSAQSFRTRHPLGSHIPLSLEHLGIPATAMQLWASLLLQCECYCTASLLLRCKCIPATANATALHPCYCTASLLLHCIVANVMNAVLQMLLF